MGTIKLGENVIGKYSGKAFETILSRTSETKLKAAIEAGEIPAQNEARARERLAELINEREAIERGEAQALKEREISIAERSATAAERSARWASLAVVISLAALLIAAWPLFPFNK